MVTGSLNSERAEQTFRVEFFANVAAIYGAFHGEGET